MWTFEWIQPQRVRDGSKDPESERNKKLHPGVEEKACLHRVGSIVLCPAEKAQTGSSRACNLNQTYLVLHFERVGLNSKLPIEVFMKPFLKSQKSYC